MRPKETKEVVEMIKRIENGGGSVDIATEINSSSTNDQAAGAKAVYDYASQKPTFPENNTNCWIKKRDIIVLDCAKFAEALDNCAANKSISGLEEYDYGIVLGDEGANLPLLYLWFDEETEDGIPFSWEFYAYDENNENIQGEGIAPKQIPGTTQNTDVGYVVTTLGETLTGYSRYKTKGEPIDLGKVLYCTKADTDTYVPRYVSAEEVGKFLTITRPSE